ncbi:biotin carboxylase N-terminal domain-containing protein [Corynebacterium glyciniphilum]|uniref:acetyl/propionyl/methylcrotonyl-CoA carboxylase subunit alpha n=1 Tax=Corynebacterium glyciniphilum TaxID=1404244 RepID=UPI00264ACA25|nr:biotin carboxylase N-terminal domain-containing protein [Corynebacterium glyciniphilum]MDN5684177.1 ATP-grasp domain-containing protein [Corynebacterium glyciniphilum]MDN6705541.1 ATP-grasp domain-containing protein [Corynebacterium glyciniphilum]
MTVPDNLSGTAFDTVLVANRGEIACRVIRSVHRAGLRAVAVYSDADAGAPHVAAADAAVRLGPAPAAESYLDIDRVIAAAVATGSGAVHPGYGFLSENAAFARACHDAGIVFIGPPAEAIAGMGDKITARATVEKRGVPTVPGLSRPGLTDEELVAGVTGSDGGAGVEFPVLVKPSAGGGGKGMHVVADPADLPEVLTAARREAASTFGDDTLFIEHFVDTPRHVEVQVMADAHGNVIHLGERECSLQRRHQKVIEEAPSVLLDTDTRARIGEAACDAARACGYRGAGTVEFIVPAARPDTFYFMEMNTRLQVEHPVTEMVTGLDLVELQIRVAQGEPLPVTQDQVALTGHAVEARVYAEDPANGFLPTGGRITALRWPDGPGVRVDAGVVEGQEVTSDYDPMLAKVIAHGAARDRAVDRLDSALADMLIVGPGTNTDFNRFLLRDTRVRAGDLDTGLLDRIADDFAPPEAPGEAVLAAALALRDEARAQARGAGHHDVWAAADGWRPGGETAPFRVRLAVPGVGPTDVVLYERAGGVSATRTAVDAGDQAGQDGPFTVIGGTGGTTDTTRVLAPAGSAAGSRRWVSRPVSTPDGPGVAVSGEPGTWVLHRLSLARDAVDAAAGEDDVLSPMPGTVVDVRVGDGDTVTAGQPLIAVEAMKMEHSLTASHDGTVEVRCAVGDKVAAGTVLATVID